MAAFQKHMNSEDMSHRIYREIMSIPSHHPHSNKRASSAKSANAQVSFVSPCNSARSSLKASQNAIYETYSDFDIIKSRSWSGSKLKGNNFINNSSAPGKADNLSRSVSSSPAPLRSSVPSPAPDRSSVGSPGLPAGRRLQSPRVGIYSAANNLAVGDSKGRVLQQSTAKGSQVDRLHQEWAALEHCRAMKRASEMVQHRMDPMYQLSGSNVPLLQRYHVDESELQRLRDMAETSRILQTDLKRIKFPHTGPRTPRRESRNQVSRGKSQQTSGKTVRTAADEVAGNDTNDSQQPDNELKTSEEANATADHLHPTSPVSSPDATPRVEGEADQQEEQTIGDEGEITVEENGEQGEVTIEDSAGQREVNDEEEVEEEDT